MREYSYPSKFQSIENPSQGDIRFWNDPELGLTGIEIFSEKKSSWLDIEEKPMKQSKFYIVINEDEDHPNQSQNRCETLEEAIEKASYLVNRYPHLSFVVFESKNLVRVKNPVEVVEFK